MDSVFNSISKHMLFVLCFYERFCLFWVGLVWFGRYMLPLCFRIVSNGKHAHKNGHVSICFVFVVIIVAGKSDQYLNRLKSESVLFIIYSIVHSRTAKYFSKFVFWFCFQVYAPPGDLLRDFYWVMNNFYLLSLSLHVELVLQKFLFSCETSVRWMDNKVFFIKVHFVLLFAPNNQT